MIIAIDGPTASGKGTVAKRIAAHFRLKRLDTGALYRAVALALLDAGEDPANEAAAARAARTLDAERIDEHRIRSAEVGYAASVVAAMAPVREALITLQRDFAQAPEGAVLDGRDIATVICPEADVKLFVTASLTERAKRRWLELEARGEPTDLADLTRQIEARDERDANRPISPLRQAPDAHLLDTTGLSIDEAAKAAIRIIEAALSRPQA
ncbi:MAG: (d)CMP kinase [Hyphomonadaceae bacterium]